MNPMQSSSPSGLKRTDNSKSTIEVVCTSDSSHKFKRMFGICLSLIDEDGQLLDKFTPSITITSEKSVVCDFIMEHFALVTPTSAKKRKVKEVVEVIVSLEEGLPGIISVISLVHKNNVLVYHISKNGQELESLPSCLVQLFENNSFSFIYRTSLNEDVIPNAKLALKEKFSDINNKNFIKAKGIEIASASTLSKKTASVPSPSKPAALKNKLLAEIAELADDLKKKLNAQSNGWFSAELPSLNVQIAAVNAYKTYLLNKV